MIDLDFIQACLDKKTEDNTQFGKSYYLDKQNMTIKKVKPDHHCQFEYECAKYFCNWYKKNLNLNFEIYKKDNKIVTIAPILNCIFDETLPPEKRLKNTKAILNQFIKDNRIFKDMLITPELVLKIYIEDCSIDNFFEYNGEMYLLDLETFYFCVYTHDNYNIGIDGIKEDYEKFVRNYNPIPGEVEHFHDLREGGLIY